MDLPRVPAGVERGLPEPEEIRVPADVKSKLRAIGARGLAVIYFDDLYGPVMRYFYADEGSEFVKSLLSNPAVAVELSIVSKHAKELRTASGATILIEQVRGDMDRFGRHKTHLVLLELRGKHRVFPRELLAYLATRLSQMGLDRRSIVRALIEKVREKRRFYA